MARPTITELEAILQNEEEVPIEILPNGEVWEKGQTFRYRRPEAASPSRCVKTWAVNTGRGGDSGHPADQIRSPGRLNLLWLGGGASDHRRRRSRQDGDANFRREPLCRGHTLSKLSQPNAEDNHYATGYPGQLSSPLRHRTDLLPAPQHVESWASQRNIRPGTYC